MRELTVAVVQMAVKFNDVEGTSWRFRNGFAVWQPSKKSI